MKITDVKIICFKSYADRFDIGQAKPLPKQEINQTLTIIETDEEICGYFFGGGLHGDQDGLGPSEQQIILGRVKDLLIDQDPYDREMIWKWMWVANIDERVASVIDIALWDLAGRALKQPIYKLMGTARDSVKAYASTYPNIGQPKVYADCSGSAEIG